MTLGRRATDEVDTIAGKTLAILGLGAIGRGVAAAARALGMRTVGIRRAPADVEPGVDVVHGPSALHEVLALADVVVVAVPSTPATRGWIDATAIARFKQGNILVDVARGGIVDESAVVAALASGRLAGAALDVFEHEPLPPASPLWSTPGLIITPHNARLGRNDAARLLERALDNLARLIDGRPSVGEIDRTRGYLPTRLVDAGSSTGYDRRMQPCPACSRPLHVDASSCPFCGATIRTGRAPAPGVLGLVVALGLASCGGDDADSATASSSMTMTTGQTESGSDTGMSATGMSATGMSATGMSASNSGGSSDATTDDGTSGTTVTMTTADSSGTDDTGGTSDTGTTTLDPTDDTALPPYGSPMPSSRWA